VLTKYISATFVALLLGEYNAKRLISKEIFVLRVIIIYKGEYMFKRAIVKTPGKSMINGLTTAELGLPNYEKALIQHKKYIKALDECGLEVIVLEESEQYPDSTFIEDVALLTRNLAIITKPTIEGGDIMMVGSHFYIGLSERTNESGAKQVIKYLEKYGMSGSVIRLEKMFHLKTGVAYLEHNNLVASGELLTKEEFQKFNILKIEEDERYAANCIWINDRVLIPKGYPKARETIEGAGYMIKEVDVSEFRKLDGGLSCLSLRF